MLTSLNNLVKYYATHLHLLPRLRTGRAVTIPPLYAIMVCTVEALPFLISCV